MDTDSSRYGLGRSQHNNRYTSATSNSYEETFLKFCSTVLEGIQQKLPQPQVEVGESNCTSANYRLNGKGPRDAMRCLNFHLNNMKEYQEFQNKLASTKTMIEDISKLQNQYIYDGKIISDEIIQTIYKSYTDLVNITADVSSLAATVPPIDLRNKHIIENGSNQAASVIVSYTAGGVLLKEGDRIVILDNTDQLYWKIKTLQGDLVNVPSVLIHIPAPDITAINKAERLVADVMENLGSLRKFIERQFSFRSWRLKFRDLRISTDSSKTERLHLNLSPGLDSITPSKQLKKRIIELKQVVVSEVVEEDIVEQSPTDDTLDGATEAAAAAWNRPRSGSIAKFTISHVYDPQNKLRRLSINLEDTHC